MIESAALVGASGLVGGRLLESLSDVPRLEVWTRRPIPLPPNAHARVSPDVPDEEDIFWRVGALFLALGTTIAKAGSREAFEAVDRELVVECARRARRGGCATLALVSATGADAGSKIFYNRVKGLAEDDIRGLGFPRLAIARPSLLLGDRAERRAGEWVARRLLGPVRNLLPRAVRPVRDAEVARALVDAVRDPDWSGVRILENRRLVG